ncbi:MAG: DNA/RNA nuclease SfsA, partial [Anaerovoracaceae bacterium]
YFTPNRKMHKEFADTLTAAKKAGVHIIAYECDVTPDSISITSEVPVIL